MKVRSNVGYVAFIEILISVTKSKEGTPDINFNENKAMIKQIEEQIQEVDSALSGYGYPIAPHHKPKINSEIIPERSANHECDFRYIDGVIDLVRHEPRR